MSNMFAYAGTLVVAPNLSIPVTITPNDLFSNQYVQGVQQALAAYAASPIGLHLLALEQPNSIDVIITSNGPSRYSVEWHRIFINPNNMNLTYRTAGGVEVPYSLAHILNHELSHLLTGWDDNAAFNSLVNSINATTLAGLPRLAYDKNDFGVRCFTGDTSVKMSDGQSKAIRDIKVGDIVMSFDPAADGGRGALVPKRVKRLFRNTTTEWIKLTWIENGEAKELVATPGHHMLDKTGAFTRLDLMVQNGKAEVVLASGEVVEAKAELITYSAEKAHLFEQAASHTQPAANGAVGLMN